jgi:hypothetical protein
MTKISTIAAAGALALSAMISQAPALPLSPMPVLRASGATNVFFRRGFYVDRGIYYYNGYRGFVRFRPGYRYYNGYWFPAGAFAAGVAAGAAIAGPVRPAPGERLAAAHVRWCSDHYATYRAWDNSYRPYVGPRRQCLSPFG